LSIEFYLEFSCNMETTTLIKQEVGFLTSNSKKGMSLSRSTSM